MRCEAGATALRRMLVVQRLQVLSQGQLRRWCGHECGPQWKDADKLIRFQFVGLLARSGLPTRHLDEQ